MMLVIFMFAVCLFQIEALKSDFATKEEAEQYVSEFLVYYDHLKGGNVNENFEFIQMYISRDFVICYGGECTEGRDQYIQTVNSLNRIVKDWTLQIDVRNYGRKYLSLYTVRTTTFENGEVFTIPAEATLILNADGSWRYWVYNPNKQQYMDEFSAIVERNSGVQKKDDL
eukprot:UN12596